jgi:mannosyl-3-phosphoglycerate phosphatase family protein
MLIFTLMKQKKQIIIFTDLDGSLLNKDTFRFDEIEDYFRELISIGIKIIPNSSKTEAELSDFNNQYNLNLSFVAENGSSIHGLNLIHKNLPKRISLSRTTDQIYKVYSENIPSNIKQKITFILRLKSKEQKEIFGLPLNKMLLAIKRNHSIPIQFNGSESEKKEFINIINDCGLTIQTGGRIMNICDNVNKSKAMSKTMELINKEIDNEIITIGVGDNQNDIDMLKHSDYPCLVKNNSFDSSLLNIDNLIKSTEPSPRGWADVIKTAIQKIKT